MKKCPYCKSEIQENASFCLYCMKNLSEKKDVTPKKRPSRKPYIIVFSVLALLAVMIAATILLHSCLGKETDSIPEADSDAIIASFDDIVLRATYLTGKDGLSDLWDPDSFVLTHQKADSDGDLWEIYSPDVYIDGVYVSLNLCEDGEEILTTVTGVTDESLSDALQLCECLISSVYNYSYDNLTDLLTDKRKYPMSVVEDGTSLAALAELNDPESSLYDKGSTPQLERMSIDITEDGTVDMFYDLRTRTYGGKVYYDIFFLHVSD